jgi:hypothetical protein
MITSDLVRTRYPVERCLTLPEILTLVDNNDNDDDDDDDDRFVYVRNALSHECISNFAHFYEILYS